MGSGPALRIERASRLACMPLVVAGIPQGSVSRHRSQARRTPQATWPTSQIAGRTKRRDVVRAREMLMTIGVERFRLRVKDLAEALKANYDTASLWGRRGAKRRAEDPDFAQRIEAVVAAVVPSGPHAAEREHTNV